MAAGHEGIPASGRTNPVIFQQFPRPIRELYGAVVVERSLPARHAKLCKLGEGALGLYGVDGAVGLPEPAPHRS